MVNFKRKKKSWEPERGLPEPTRTGLKVPRAVLEERNREERKKRMRREKQRSII